MFDMGKLKHSLSFMTSCIPKGGDCIGLRIKSNNDIKVRRGFLSFFLQETVCVCVHTAHVQVPMYMHASYVSGNSCVDTLDLVIKP